MTTPPSATDALPELTDERVDEIEERIFARIGDDRARAAKTSAARGRMWLGGIAAAIVIAVAVVIAPSVLAGLGTGMSTSSMSVADLPTDMVIEDDGGSAEALVEPESGDADSSAAFAGEGRQIVASASVSLVTDDVRGTADRIAADVQSRGGYVESMTVGTGPGFTPVDIAEADASTATHGWVSVRVPADQLEQMMSDLDALGEITTTSVDRFDVTDQVIDLQARADAAQASVERLTQLLAEAESVSDLVATESALAERQATFESYEQQLELLQNQVSMSSLSVSLESPTEQVDANPAGFWDGLVAGWNGLIAALNGLIVALGFVLPWLAIVGVIGLSVWGIVRLIRRSR